MHEAVFAVLLVGIVILIGIQMDRRKRQQLADDSETDRSGSLPLLSEAEAAKAFVSEIRAEIVQNWPGIRARLSPFVKGDLDRSDVAMEFSLAHMTLALRALPNLFPPDRAQRIRDHVEQVLVSEGFEPALLAIAAYEQAFRDAIDRAEMPTDALGATFLRRTRISAPSPSRSGFVSPLALLAMSELFTYGGGLGWWKHATEKHEIVR